MARRHGRNMRDRGLRTVPTQLYVLMNSAEFYAPLKHTLVLERGTGSPTFTRATTATFTDWEGVLRTAPAGCARFEGGRMVRNLFTNTGWSGAVSGTYGTPPAGWLAGVGAGTLTVSDSTEYPGHKQIQFSGTAQRPFIYQAVSVAANSVYVESVRLIENQANYSAINNLIVGVSLPSGATEEFLINDVVVAATTVPEAGDVISYRLTTAGTAGTPNIRVGLGCQIGSTGSATFVAPQWEDVTGQADQTASEYVSVGALDYRTDADPLYLSLPGTAGRYASTPDSVANSITGDIDIRCKVALTDWTPATLKTLVAKYGGGGSRSYLFGVDGGSTGNFCAIYSADGTTVLNKSATAAPVVADGSDLHVRLTIDVDNGAGGNTVTFYTSNDGEDWSQLGDPVVTAGTISLFDSAQIVEIGSDTSGLTDNLAGKIYSAQIYDEIDGTTPVVDFNPHRDATTPTGTITSSTTGEVWTINGASSVVRNAAYHGAGVDGVEFFDTDRDGNPLSPQPAYLAEGARTNLWTCSQDFDNAAWTKTSITVVANDAVAPDGTTTADKLTNDNASSILDRIATVTANTIYTDSMYLKYGNNTWVRILYGTGVNAVQLWVNLQTGAIGTVTASGGTAVMSAYRVTAAANGFWRIEAAVNLGGAVTAFQRRSYLVNADNSGTIVAAAYAHHWGAQVELGSFASSYIPTTTAAVTRNADVLTYPSAGNVDGTKGWCSAAVTCNWSASPSANKALLATRVVNDLGIWYVTTGNQLNLLDGVATHAAAVAFTASSSPQKVSATWNVAQNMSLGSVGGVNGATNTFVSAFAPNQIGVGIYKDGATSYQEIHWHGTISNVCIGQRALSSSELQAITS